MTYVRALKQTLLGTALPYGFTITFLASSQVLIQLQGHSPNVGQVFLFAAGAALAYGVLRVVLERVEPEGEHPSQTGHPVRGGIVHVASIGGAIGACALVGLIDGGVVWPLGAFCAMLVYLVGNAVEVAIQTDRGD